MSSSARLLAFAVISHASPRSVIVTWQPAFVVISKVFEHNGSAEQLIVHKAISQAAGFAELAQVANDPAVTAGNDIFPMKKQTSPLLIPCALKLGVMKNKANINNPIVICVFSILSFLSFCVV